VVGAILVGAALIGCEGTKGEAERAIDRAERMVTAMRDRAVKVVPIETKALTDSLQAVKDRFAAKDYVGALDGARATQARAIELANSLAGKSTELSSAFMAFSGRLNETVARIRRRVSGSPPAGVDRAAFEALKADLANWDETWKAATNDFQNGDFGSANLRADSLRVKIAAAQALLGIPPETK
jgi:hypothetical protein